MTFILELAVFYNINSQAITQAYHSSIEGLCYSPCSCREISAHWTLSQTTRVVLAPYPLCHRIPVQFSLAVEIYMRYCKILHDPVVASGILPDMFLEAIIEHNLEQSFPL
jgi:hypothetical protein